MKKKDQLGPRFTFDETPVTYERTGYELAKLCKKGKRRTVGSSASRGKTKGMVERAGDEDRSARRREKLSLKDSTLAIRALDENHPRKII